MDIYNLLRFLVYNCRPEIENPARNHVFDVVKKASIDLIDELEAVNAFGTMAAIKRGMPFHE
jgi:hypothetical protein